MNKFPVVENEIKIGIAIVTYNRLEYLKRTVDCVKSFTASPYELVVAEDGGTDMTREWCRNNGVPLVTGINSGVCWNKNRGLYFLNSKRCNPILLLEDDCRPNEIGWEKSWIEATKLWGHLSYAHPKLKKWQIEGAGIPTDPFVNFKASAQCTSVSSDIIEKIGYLDSRFKGYGVGHAEWTSRIKRAGYGFKKVRLPDGRRARANLYINGGLIHDDAPTFKDAKNIEINEELFDALKKEHDWGKKTIFPWVDEAEHDRFIKEVQGMPD